LNKLNIKKKIIILFKNQTDYEFFYRNKNLCLELIKNFKNIKFLNLNNKYKHNISKKYQKYFYRVKNFEEFKIFLNNIENCICISFIEKKLENFNIFKLFKKKNILIIEIFRDGDLRDAKYFFNLNYLDSLKKINKIFMINVNFVIYSLSYFFNILPKTDFLFHYNNNTQDQIGYFFSDSYKFTLLTIFKKIFLRKNIFFKKIYLITSKSSDELIQKEKVKSKYIVFLDSCFDHSDRAEYDSKPNDIDKKEYYSEIHKAFKEKKDFIFLLHPSSNFLQVKKYLKDILIVKYKTRFYLKRSKIVLFHESSSILDAIYLKKKMISLDSDYLGRYFRYRNKLYSKALNLKTINLSDDENKHKIMNKTLNRSSIKSKKQKKYVFLNQSNRIGLKDIINKIKNC
jgi:hypothetical protein